MDFETLDEQFNCLSIKFIFCCENGSQLNQLLSELLGLDYKNQQIVNSKSIVQFLDSLLKIPITSDPNVIAKACQLIKQLVSKQKIVLPENVSTKLILWILRCCDTKSLDLFYCEAIDALAVLFKTNLAAVQQHAAKLLTQNGILLKFINKSLAKNPHKSLSVDSTPQEIYKSALPCIEMLLFNLASPEAEAFEIDEEEFRALGKTIISFVFALKPDELSEHDFVTIAALCNNCLRLVISIESDFASEFTGELIGVGQSFMMYAIPGFEYRQPIKIMSSQQAIVDPVAKLPTRKGTGTSAPSKVRKIRRSKKKPEKPDDYFRSYKLPEAVSSSIPYPAYSVYRTSDSDYSDTEHSRQFANRYRESKLRVSALELLFAISLNVDKKQLFGYWHSLFTTEESSSVTLANCLLKDTSPRCKIIALQVIIQMVRNAKPLLNQAENKEKTPATFTPFSATLGNMITFTYEKLTQALIKEGDLTVLTQILKCISVLITVTPFHRLKPGIVTSFFKYARHLTRHKDPTVKVGALIVMENLISINEITPEIYELMEIPRSKIKFSWKKIDASILNSAQDDDEEIVDLEFDEDEEEVEEGGVKPEATKMSWLVQTVLENLGVVNGALKFPSPVTSVRIGSLQVISALGAHFSLLKDHQRSISIALVHSFKHSIDDQLFTARTLEALSNSINVYLSEDKKHLEDLDQSSEFWLNMMPTVIEKIQDNSQAPALRMILADGVANMGIHIFEKFDRQKQINLISVLTGCTYDDDGSVKSSAVRALAMYAVFPSLREDLCFIENTIESILRVGKNPLVVVRTKATWSLGNVVDALVISRETTSINENLFRLMFKTSLEAMNDHDRVKAHAVRTTGNMITLLTKEQLNDSAWLKLFEESIQTLRNLLVKCNSVKVQWNVCYSFASIMKNQVFFEPSLKFKLEDLIFPALCDIIKTSPNFKVRISACTVFTIPSRQNFGAHFMKIWSCLLEALEQSNNMTDFSEYKHRDTLQDQICTSICHLIELAAAEDVIQMKNEVFPLIDITKQNWNRVFNRWLPECQGQILKASTSLKNISCKSSEQKNSIDILISCFQPIEQF